MHEKGLQRQTGVGTLVSSQEQRARLVPLINRWSNAGQPLILILRRFYVRIRLFVLPKSRSRECFRFAGGQERGLSFCRIDLTAAHLFQPRAAPVLRRARPRPDPPVVCPGFGFDKCYISLVRHLLNPKPRHTTGGSGRSARRSGREKSGKIVCQQNYSSRRRKSTVPTKASKRRRFNDSPEARTSEFLC